MKRIIALVFVLLFVVASTALADTPETIKFRGLEWTSTRGDVHPEIMKLDGVEYYKGSDKVDAKIDGWFRKYEYVYGKDLVKDSGVEVTYYDVPVAGYNATLNVYYTYSINEDGSANTDPDKAVLYKAEYRLFDLADPAGAYEDLKEKLSSTYGEYTDKDYKDGDLKGVLFQANDGSMVYLYNRNDKTVGMVYCATVGGEQLEAVAEALKVSEGLKRQENAGNTEGL